MNVSPITVLAPKGNAPASPETAPSGDLFGDLLRAPASGTAAKPAAPSPSTESRPVSEPKPADRADRPARKERDGKVEKSESRDGTDGAVQKTDAQDAEETAGPDGGEQTDADGETQPNANPNTETKAGNGGQQDGQIPVNAAASEVAAAVLALINSSETRAPAEVGVIAANTAVTAAGAAGTPAVTAKSVVPETAPPPAEEVLLADEPGPTSAPALAPATAKKGPAPAQITVTDESKALVSRPAQTLATANVQDIAEAPAQPQTADPKTTVNAAIPPDEGAAKSQGQSGEDGGGKTTPVHDPVLKFAANTAKTADVAAATSQGADTPAPQTQTHPSNPLQVPNPVVTAPVYAAGHAAAAPAANVVLADRPVASPPAPGLNIDHVALQIGKAAADGMDRINIQLKPEAMGRIDVQLQVHSDGRVHAVVTADRHDTLDLLQRDARSLERALNDAGLRADAGSLSFNLNGRGQDNGSGAPADSLPSYAGNADGGEPQPVPAGLIAAYDAAAARGGIDIRV